jgi:hypothetical protein
VSKVGLFLTVLLLFISRDGLTQTLVAVPFHGCRSDGQVGPIPAPAVPDRVIQVEAAFSQRLSYYKAEFGTGVLAPRGWNCFGIYGSAGSHLVVTPSIFDDGSFEATAALVQVSDMSGGTSGRFAVAEVVARIFPAYRDFARNILRDLTPRTYSFVPYPSDRLTYRSDRIVEYETPPRTEGLGTFAQVKPTDDPIRGVAVLRGTEPDLDLVLISMRLPSNMTDLGSPIIQKIQQQN